MPKNRPAIRSERATTLLPRGYQVALGLVLLSSAGCDQGNSPEVLACETRPVLNEAQTVVSGFKAVITQGTLQDASTARLTLKVDPIDRVGASSPPVPVSTISDYIMDAGALGIVLGQGGEATVMITDNGEDTNCDPNKYITLR